MIIKNVRSNKIKKMFDVLNRAKGFAGSLANIEGRLHFVMIAPNTITTLDLEKEVEEDFSIDLDIKNTSKINRAINYFKGPLMDIDIDDYELSIADNTKTLKINTKPRMDILLPTESDVESVNTIDGVIFKEILDDLSKVRGKASGRPVLDGISLVEDGFLGVDGYRLALIKHKLSLKDEFAIHADAVFLMQKFLIKYKDEVKVIKKKDTVDILIGDDLKIIQRQNFTAGVLDYKDVIRPASDDTSFLQVNKKEFTENINYLKDIASINTNRPGSVALSETIDGKLSMKSLESKNRHSIKEVGSAIINPIDMNLQDLRIAFNPEFMLDALNIDDSGEEVAISFNEALNPIIIRGDKKLNLILPVRLADDC